MNERILELAEQAEHRYYPSSNSGPLRVEYLTPELEKFAELIVKECASVNYNSPFQDGEFHAREVLEHFGVEE
jgi:hypothetical protein